MGLDNNNMVTLSFSADIEAMQNNGQSGIVKSIPMENILVRFEVFNIPPDYKQSYTEAREMIEDYRVRLDQYISTIDRQSNEIQNLQNKYFALLKEHSPSLDKLREIVATYFPNGARIQAIKAVREMTALSLIEAKRLVDGIWEELSKKEDEED